MSARSEFGNGRWGRALLSFGAVLWLVACATGTPGEGDVCGDGTRGGDEECDDGNLNTGDGCDALCAVEPGFVCDGSGDTYCHAICGDGLVLGAETCDGSDIGGVSCESLELGVGEVVCGADCRLDTSGCQPSTCGNGALDAGEACDGNLVGDETCETQGYDGGSLACTQACEIDTSGCTLASCGNGIVEGVETCDDADLEPGDGCSANCSVEQGWICVGQPSVCARLCGNGVLDAGEECDGASLGGHTCTSLGQGFVGGTLLCSAACTYDTGLCELPTCGNGALDAGEQCDGVLLGGQTCQTVGSYIGGTLLCSGSCAYNVSNCVPIVCGDGVVSPGEACDDNNQQSGDGCNVACNVETGWECDPATEPSVCTPLCGNNQLDANEDCDGGQLGGATCQSLGFDMGSLACATGCSYDTSGCSMFSCGDGQVTGLEDCDGANLDGATCQSLGFVSGALSCTGNCGFDTSACVAPACGDGITTGTAGEQCDDGNPTTGDGCNAACQVENGYVCDNTQQPSVCTLSCGNGAVDPGEDCDGALLNGGTCQGLGFAGGTLSCAACSYDTSACLTQLCANGVREGTEECDGSDFGGQTCGSYGFSGGTLTCAGDCTIDTSSCSTCPATLTSVFSEDFASPSSSSWTTGSDAVVNGSIWSAYTLPNHGVRIYNGRLEITNDVSGWPQHGQGYAYVKAGGAGSDYDNTQYSSTLKNNAAEEVVWSLNMRRNDPDTTDGGFSCSSTASQNAITVGLAYVLAGSSASGLNASTSTCNASATAYGYAVVMGGSSGSVRLVRFANGLRNGTLTNIVSSGGFDPDRYFSVRVTYNAVTDQWRLEARSDGGTSFSDPATGTYSFSGTGTDSTYVNFALDYTGPYFQTGCTGLCDVTYTAAFDNVDVGVRCAP